MGGKVPANKTTVNPKERKFIIQYCLDRDGTQAAIRAGYSKKTASVQGSQLLSRLKRFIEPLLKKQDEQIQAVALYTREQWMRRIQAIAFQDVRKLFDAHGNPIEIPELGDEAAAAIAGFEFYEDFEGKGESRKAVGYTKKFKMLNALDALKYYGEVTGYHNPPEGNAAPTVIHNMNILVAPHEAYLRMVRGK